VRTRREWLCLAAGLVLGGSSRAADVPFSIDENDVEVWKSATCGCCSLWVEHMRFNGFLVRAHDVGEVTPFRRKLGVPDGLASCHSALVATYALEGHVPADVVRQFLKDRPSARGLALPGMPMGSPGMEGPRRDRFAVIAFYKDGTTKIFARR
jgi:hypothetical protein